MELVGEEINAESYVWKSMTIITGIYVFFNIERILKMILDFRKVSMHCTFSEMYSFAFVLEKI